MNKVYEYINLNWFCYFENVRIWIYFMSNIEIIDILAFYKIDCSIVLKHNKIANLNMSRTKHDKLPLY